MSLFNRSDQACPQFEARLEEYLEALEAAPSARPAPDLAGHLAACAGCREAFDLACAAGPLVREAAIAVPDSLAADPFFAARVGARIREQAARAPEFLPMLQTISLRLMAAALTAALFLGAISASGVARVSPRSASRLRASDLRAISSNSNPTPVNPDEVIIALFSASGGGKP